MDDWLAFFRQKKSTNHQCQFLLGLYAISWLGLYAMKTSFQKLQIWKIVQ